MKLNTETRIYRNVTFILVINFDSRPFGSQTHVIKYGMLKASSSEQSSIIITFQYKDGRLPKL